MTDTTTQPTKSKKSKLGPLWLILKILFGLIVLIAIGITILANIGGNSQALKDMLEGYFQDSTGYQAEIGQLNNITFFPNVSVDFENLKLSEPGKEQTAVNIEKLNLKMGFWDVIAGNGRVKNVGINNLKMRAGVVTQDPLTINSLGITDDQSNADTATLTLNGSLDTQPLSASATLAAYGQGNDRTYDLGKERTINVQAGDISISGEMKNPSFKNIELENLLVKQGNQTWLTGNMDITVKNQGRQLEGTLNFGKGSIVQADMFVGDNRIEGTMQSDRMHVEDIAIIPAITTKASQILPQKGSSNNTINLQGQNVDVTAKLDSIIMNGRELGSQTITVKIADAKLDLKAENGKIAGGTSNITATLTPTENQYQLVTTATITKMPAEKLVEVLGQTIKITTHIDTAMNMQSTANNWDALMQNFKGRVTTTVDKGEFDNRLLNLWGSGLGNLVLPNFNIKESASLNCAILDADITKSVATFKTLFADTKDVRLVGTGTYNIDQDQLNIGLKPQPKGITIGDISAGVKITGPLENPSISADMVDLGKKAAGLLLGTVNPAFFAANNIDATALIGNVFDALTPQDEKPAAQQQALPQTPAALCEKLGTFGSGNKAQDMAQYLSEAAQAAQQPAQ